MMHLTEKEVNAEIAIREVNGITRESLQELANLYIVRDHMTGNTRPYDLAYSQAMEPIPAPETAGEYGGSEFLQSIAGKDLRKVWDIMDELMDTLHVTNSRVYDSVMRKIRES